MVWLQDKLRPVERRVKGRPKKCEVIRLGEQQNELKYSRFRNLHPQPLNRFSAAYSLVLRRLLAANPQPNPQIFRAFSASFAHVVVRDFFRRLCAAISQELATWAAKKMAKRRRNLRPAENRSRLAVRRWPFAFSAVTRGTSDDQRRFQITTPFSANAGVKFFWR